MQLYLTTDEFGRYWIVDENDQPVHGPCDTEEEADETIAEDEMMDIVERLRNFATPDEVADEMMSEAADEIEKLRKLLGLAAAAIDFADNAIKQLQQSNCALREALGKKEKSK
jgi:hypothetical protein